jgi:hypothetical protein
MHQTNQQRGQCKVAKLDSSGGTVRWESTCTQASDATAVHSEGVAHYTGDTMTADVKTVVNSPGGAPYDMTQHCDRSLSGTLRCQVITNLLKNTRDGGKSG